MRLNVRAFAFACGILWGAGVFLATWWILLLDGSSDQYTFLARIYRGYSLTPLGSLIGGAWGLVDGVIGGTIFAWLYNRFTGPKSSAAR
jgi:hypothetical protein